MQLQARVWAHSTVYPVAEVNYRTEEVTVITEKGLQSFPFYEAEVFAGPKFTDSYNSFEDLYTQRDALACLVISAYKGVALKVRYPPSHEFHNTHFIVCVHLAKGHYTMRCSLKFWDHMHVPEGTDLPPWGNYVSVLQLLSSLQEPQL